MSETEIVRRGVSETEIVRRGVSETEIVRRGDVRDRDSEKGRERGCQRQR